MNACIYFVEFLVSLCTRNCPTPNWPGETLQPTAAWVSYSSATSATYNLAFCFLIRFMSAGAGGAVRGKKMTLCIKLLAWVSLLNSTTQTQAARRPVCYSDINNEHQIGGNHVTHENIKKPKQTHQILVVKSEKCYPTVILYNRTNELGEGITFRINDSTAISPKDHDCVFMGHQTISLSDTSEHMTYSPTRRAQG